MIKRKVSAALVATVLMSAAHQATAELWDVQYDGNGLPDPAVWAGSANSAQYNPNDKFTSGDQVPGWLTATGNAGGLFDGEFSTKPNTEAGGWTAEWSLQSNPELASQPVTELVQFSDDTNLISVRYDPDSVTLRDHLQLGQTVSLDTTTDHTYRLVRQPGSPSVQLYIDDEYAVPAASFTPDASGLDGGNLNHLLVAPSKYEAAYDFWRFHSGAFVPPSGPQWTSNGVADWNGTDNWIGGVPNGTNAVANLLGVIMAGHTIYTDTPITVGTLKFDNANTYNIAGLGSLTLDSSSGAGSISVLQGSQKINLPLFFNSDTNIAVAGGATLTIADPATIRAGKTVTTSGNLLVQAPLTIETGGALVLASSPITVFGAPSLASGAKVDVKNNSMTIDYRGQSTPASTIRAQLASGFASGNWTGSGIDSSSTIAGKTGVGWKDDPSSQSINVKFTYYGDANLDRIVNSDDFALLAMDFGSSGVWSGGDFNYDGIVNALDFNALASNYGNTLSAPLPGALVPEPTSFCVIGLLAAGLLPRRGHRSIRKIC